MHLFLTGFVQVGKSTLIRRLLEKKTLKLGGFKTKWYPEGDSRILVMTPYTDIVSDITDDSIAARDIGKDRITYPEVFDTIGKRILEDSTSCDLIVMDELGRLETNSEDFQRAVISVLDGDTPVIGVIQPRQTRFLDSIRARRDVMIIPVSEDNRNELYSLLSEVDIISKLINKNI